MHLSPAPAKGYFCDILKSNIFQPLFLPDTEAFVSLSNKFPGFAFFSCTSSNSFFGNFFQPKVIRSLSLKTLLYEFSNFHLYIGIILSVI